MSSAIQKFSKYLCYSILILLSGMSAPTYAQNAVYDFSYKKNEQSLLKTLVFYAGVQMHHFSIDRVVIQNTDRVNPEKLWKIDQKAIHLFSKSSDDWSDLTMYSSIAMPFILNIGSQTKKKEKWNIALMGLQGFMIENGINSLSKNIFQRPRPFLYNNGWIMGNRPINKNSSRSFYSGHTSSAAYFCFFGAKVFSDLHPESKWKPYVWGLAITLPAITGYLRYDAGKHFPTDIIVGYVAGASIGYLLPAIYKSKKADLSVGSTGLSLSIKL